MGSRAAGELRGLVRAGVHGRALADEVRVRAHGLDDEVWT